MSVLFSQKLSSDYVSMYVCMYVDMYVCMHACMRMCVCIRKYGSTFYVGIGQVKNGHLYLRYGSNSEKNTAK